MQVYQWIITVLVMVGIVGIATGQEQEELIIFAASSLTDAFTELAEKYELQNDDVRILLNFAGSSTLAAQILNGAPADVFASADQRQMDLLIDRTVVAESTEFARNRIVLIVPADNPTNIEDINDLEAEGIQIVLAAPSVPIREYTDQLLQALSNDETLIDDVMRNVVSEEGNVRQVLTKIALGEGDAGFVYASDLETEIAENVISIPLPLTIEAAYPIATISDHRHGESFIGFVRSEEGQSILARYGFTAPQTRVERTCTLP